MVLPARARILAVLAIAACGHASSAPAPAPAPPAVDESPGLSPAVDENPDPSIFELHLEAKIAPVQYLPGVTTQAWTYNGTVPGPLIDVKVGDTLVVHFKNSLPEATTIHWHGIRLPNEMDGSLAVQKKVETGGTFEYRFAFKDPGLYWFHPHHRSDEQTRRGLYGVIRVRGANEPASDHEHVLVLDDATLDASGSQAADLDDYEKLSLDAKLHGRTGNTLLVNGRASRVIELQPGAIHRFRFLNTANLRYFNLAVAGHVWRVIGTDGSLLGKPYDTANLVIGPAERYDAMLIPTGAAGATLSLDSDAYDRAEDDPQTKVAVASFRLTDVALTGRALPDHLDGVAAPRLEVPAGDPIPIELDEDLIGGSQGYTLPMEDHGGDPITAMMGDPVFVINKKAGMDIPRIEIPLGATRVFFVHNVSHQIHIFHLHGFFFQVVSTNDKYDAKLNPQGLRPEMFTQAEKDTISVRSGYGVTIVARFDAPGTWMYHCHIPEHSERGMMGEIHVAP